MVNINDKIKDFKVKFALGGWLNDEVNITTVEAWFHKNFNEEPAVPEVVFPVEEIVVGESLPSASTMRIEDTVKVEDEIEVE